MANSYRPGKWSGELQADVRGDASKTTASLGDDFDSELRNLQKAKANIDSDIRKITKQISALKNHPETGKMATDYLKNTERRLNKIKNDTAVLVNKLDKAVSAARKDEWNRMRRIVAEWEATANSSGSC